MEEKGVWRTVGGRRIFIKEGQSLTEAMKDSGKFKTNDIKIKLKKQFNENNKIVTSEFKTKEEVIETIDRLDTENDEEFAKKFYQDIKIKTIKSFDDNMIKINRGMENESDFENMENGEVRYSQEHYSAYGRGIYFYDSSKVDGNTNPYGFNKEYGVYKDKIYKLRENEQIDKIKNEVRNYYKEKDKNISTDRILMAMGYAGKITGRNDDIIVIYDKSNIYKKG